MKQTQFHLVGSILVVLMCAGCAPRMNAYDAMHNYQYESSMKQFNQVAAKREKYLTKKNKYHKNYALPYLHLASAGMAGGAYSIAETALARAMPVMQRIEESAARNVLAIVTKENARQYKGDPLERCMANFYLGLIRFMEEDYDRALALFRRALVSDMDTNNKKEVFLNDFAIGHIMAAKTYDMLEERDNAEVMLQKAVPFVEEEREFRWFCDRYLDSNFTILIEEGVGPYKISVGMGKSAIRLKKVPSKVERIDVYLDNEFLETAIKTTNLYKQAKQHKAAGGRRAIQAVKGLMAGTTRLATIGLLQLTGSKSDERSWILMPNNYYIASARVEPGLHSVMLKCFDKKGREVPRYEQVWHYVPIRESSYGNLLLMKTGLDKCNQYKKIERQYVLNDIQLNDTKKWNK